MSTIPQFRGSNRMRRFFTFNAESWAKNLLHLAVCLERCGVNDWELERQKQRASNILRDTGHDLGRETGRGDSCEGK